MIMPKSPPCRHKKSVSPQKRKARQHLTERQRAFFKCLEQEGYNINRAMMLCKIKDWLMDRWFRDPVFIAALKSRYRQIEFRTHMELTYHLPLAAMNLVNMTNGFDTDIMVKACTNILRFHNSGRPFHEYAFVQKDRPLPRRRTRSKDRLLERPPYKDPALALSRQFLDVTDADEYKRVAKLHAELEERRRRAEKQKEAASNENN